ncbi:MMPL family transporter, partial [candidate division WOR-3 bacterium]|nr:MMPL family transporter [candidate division WOR-3 bacterium]
MLEKLTKFVGKYPKTIIAAVILLTVFFYFGISKVDVVSDMEEMFPEDDPVKIAYDQVDATYGGAKFAMIVLDMDEVFSVSALQEIDRLTLELEKVKGVNSVLSITNVEEIRGTEDGIEVVELIEEIPDNEAELLELKHRVLSNDDYAGQIISENGKIALVMVQLLPEAAEENVIQDIREIVHRHELDKKSYLTGEAVLDEEVDKAIVGDMSRLLPLAILLMIGILYISFRNIRGVVLPLLIVIITVIWTMGMMGYFGIPLSPISNIMPVILISMGIADGIHILTRYREGLSHGLDKQKALFVTVVAVGLACLITSVTTMVGFGSLYTSSLSQVKDFGLSTAIGVGIAFIITVTFFLAILYLLRPAKRELDKKQRVFLKGTLVKWTGFVIARAKTVLIVAGLLVVLASAGIPLINPESDFIDFFKPGSPVRSAYNLVTENFGGANIIQIAVKGNIQDPEVLQAMEHLQNDIE